MVYYCYILYSKTLDKYYVGETEDVDQRVILHNSGFFKGSYTSKVSDWILYYSIKCISRKQARSIENHIKKMKSRKYIENLIRYFEISQKLLIKFS